MAASRRARHAAPAAPCRSAARTAGRHRRRRPPRRAPRASSGTTLQPRDRHARVLQAHAPAPPRACPTQVTRAHARGEQLEVGVPDPRDVAAVGDVVVEDRQQVELVGLERERAQDLVGAGRVLDQQDRQLAVRRCVTVSARPNAALTASSPATIVGRAGPRGPGRAPPRPARCRRCRGPGSGSCDRRRRPAGVTQRERRRAGAVQRDLLGARLSAPGAAGRSSGSGSGRGGRGRSRRIGRRAAAAAVLGVRGVLHLAAAPARRSSTPK